MKNELIDLTLLDSKKNNQIYNIFYHYIEKLGLPESTGHIINSIALLLVTIIILLIIDWFATKILKAVFIKIIIQTKIEEYVIDNKIIQKIAHLAPVILADILLPIVFAGYPIWLNTIIKIVDIILILSIVQIINVLIKTIAHLLHRNKAFVDKPLDSYTQVVQIFLMFIAGTIIFSILTGKSPISFLVSLGAASAIIILVFKDTILGFVASIEVSANDSVRVGDWIEMPKYGADGTVLKITLNNVKVQNFDNTIVTIPTQTLLTDSFKNYRGMEESGGRRIKRAINIKISSIRYLSEPEINNLCSIDLLKPFIERRQQEINTFNLQDTINQSNLVNGRRMTNIGLFREYITEYAKNNPNIHNDFTLMVRQLDPTENGLPLELYMFTTTTEWTEYEAIMADIFDHLFAAIKYFYLEVFELPASDDLRQLLNK